MNRKLFNDIRKIKPAKRAKDITTNFLVNELFVETPTIVRIPAPRNKITFNQTNTSTRFSPRRLERIMSASLVSARPSFSATRVLERSNILASMNEEKARRSQTCPLVIRDSIKTGKVKQRALLVISLFQNHA